MTQPPAFARSLQLVAEAVEVCRDPWWIIGSAAMALSGLDDVTVADIDILTSRKDAGRLGGRLGAVSKADQPVDQFRSAFLATSETPLPIEIMGALEVKTGEIWTAVRPKTRMEITLGEAVLFIPEVAEQIEILRLFGREKDLARAEALAALA